MPLREINILIDFVKNEQPPIYRKKSLNLTNYNFHSKMNNLFIKLCNYKLHKSVISRGLEVGLN